LFTVERAADNAASIIRELVAGGARIRPDCPAAGMTADGYRHQERR